MNLSGNNKKHNDKILQEIQNRIIMKILNRPTSVHCRLITLSSVHTLIDNNDYIIIIIMVPILLTLGTHQQTL